jgi:small subunit ribosomal protein S6
MRPYEIVVVLDPGLEEDAVTGVIDRTTELVRSRGGEVRRVDRWGKRRLAYELHHHWEGYYVLVDARAESPVVDELNRALLLADEVIRHKVVRVPEEVASPATPRAQGGSGAQTTDAHRTGA